jgi:excinuclease ABC subunit C
VETLSFIYRVPGVDGDNRIYLIRRGRVRAERPVPSSRRERRALARLVREVFSPEERDGAQLPTHEIDELLLLSSWFRRFPRELRRARRPDAPRKRIELSAAPAMPMADGAPAELIA